MTRTLSEDFEFRKSNTLETKTNAVSHPSIRDLKMKVLSLNFLTCAAKACKSSSDSYPLHPKDAELVQDEIELNPDMIINVLPRLDWAALRTTSSEVRCPFFFRQLLWSIFVAAGRRETWVVSGGWGVSFTD